MLFLFQCRCRRNDHWYLGNLPSSLGMPRKADTGLEAPLCVDLLASPRPSPLAVPGRLAFVGGGGTGMEMVRGFVRTRPRKLTFTMGLEAIRVLHSVVWRCFTSETAWSSTGCTWKLGTSMWWWRDMEKLFALLALCEGNPSITVGSPHKSPVIQSFGGFLVASPNHLFENMQCKCW